MLLHVYKAINTSSQLIFLLLQNSLSLESGMEEGKKKSVKSELKKNLWVICPKSKEPVAKTASPILGSPIRRRSSHVFRAIRRVVFWCTLCIISDVTTVVVALLNGPGTPLLLITALNNVNILVNQLCIVATYSKWREILCPLCCKVKQMAQVEFATSVDTRNHVDEAVTSRKHSILSHIEVKLTGIKPQIIVTSVPNPKS